MHIHSWMCIALRIYRKSNETKWCDHNAKRNVLRASQHARTRIEIRELLLRNVIRRIFENVRWIEREMIETIIAFIIAFTLQTHAIDYNYVEFRDVRDSTNNFENLRITYEYCTYNNQTQTQIEKCQKRAFNRATSIDAWFTNCLMQYQIDVASNCLQIANTINEMMWSKCKWFNFQRVTM